MRLLALFAAVVGVACGDSGDTPRPDALVCGADEMVCSGTCASTLTDEQNCGTCGNVCGANDACVAGTCMPANIHCQRVREADADAPDGTYVNPATHDAFYCDFTNGVTYDDLGVAPYNSTPADYTLITGDALAADATLQKAFIGLFNADGGVRGLQSFTSDNCCINVAMNTALLFDDLALTPLSGGSDACGGTAMGEIYYFELSGSPTGELVEAPLADDYFATHAVSQGSKCSEDVQPNPGLFYKKHTGLL